MAIEKLWTDPALITFAQVAFRATLTILLMMLGTAVTVDIINKKEG